MGRRKGMELNVMLPLENTKTRKMNSQPPAKYNGQDTRGSQLKHLPPENKLTADSGLRVWSHVLYRR